MPPGGSSRAVVRSQELTLGARAKKVLFRSGLGISVLIALFVGLMVLGVIPVRSYLTQQRDLRDSKARLTMLTQRNGELSVRAARLKTDTQVALLAREQFGMVPAGETLTLFPGLRTESTGLLGDGRDAVRPVPPDTRVPDMSLFQAILDVLSLRHR